MQVPCDEGVAIHIGPESCALVREGQGEALTGECAGQPLRCERVLFWVPTPCTRRKATRQGRVDASAHTTRRGQRPWHVQTLLAREPGDLAIDRPDHGQFVAVLARVKDKPSAALNKRRP